MRHFPNPYTNLNTDIDPELWGKQAEMLAQEIVADKRNFRANLDGGLYVGPAGIAFALWKLSTFVADKSKKYLNLAHDLITINLEAGQDSSEKDQAGFLLGACGVYAVASVIAYSRNEPEVVKRCHDTYRNLATILKSPVVHRHGSDELFVGRAGYLSGALWLNQFFRAEIVPLSELYCICDAIVLSGKNYARGRRGGPTLMYAYYGTEYLGAAHGLSSILQMVISVPGYMSLSTTSHGDIRNSIEYLLGMQDESGNFPPDTHTQGQRRRSDELVHWCHGAPGVVYLMARAYLVFGDEKYLMAAMKCGDCVWHKGLLRKGPGICHGVAGSGYVFLLLYRLTGDEVHLKRARKFAEFIYSDDFKAARQPDCPYSLYEGIAGTICFFLDLTKPSEAAFPFFNVFQPE